MRLDPAWFERAFLATIIPADFIMARSHLRGLQRRVEASTVQPIAAEPPELPASALPSRRDTTAADRPRSGGASGPGRSARPARP
jgi:hypothetical protein